MTSFMLQMTDPKPGETLFDPACGTGGFLTCAIRHMREHYVKRPEDEGTLQASLRAVEKKQLPAWSTWPTAPPGGVGRSARGGRRQSAPGRSAQRT